MVCLIPRWVQCTVSHYVDHLLQTWSDYLSSLAAGWAAGCDFEHGQPSLGDDPPYTLIGQNLYASTGGGAINLTAGIQAWYDEKVDYDYDNTECADTKVCGHYTQVSGSSKPKYLGRGHGSSRSLPFTPLPLLPIPLLLLPSLRIRPLAVSIAAKSRNLFSGFVKWTK